MAEEWERSSVIEHLHGRCFRFHLQHVEVELVSQIFRGGAEYEYEYAEQEASQGSLARFGLNLSYKKLKLLQSRVLLEARS